MDVDQIAYALFEAHQADTEPERYGVVLAAESIARTAKGTTVGFDEARFMSIATTGRPS